MINSTLKQYCEAYIIPQYQAFDEAHQPSHVYQVIENCKAIAQAYDVDPNILYAVAVFHDVGLKKGRANHEAASRDFVLQDKFLKGFFTETERGIIGEAVEDHRASMQIEPRNHYGKIISEADLDLDYHRVLLRCIQYSLGDQPDKSVDVLFRDVYNHMTTKYGNNTKIKFWLGIQSNMDRLTEIQHKLTHQAEFKQDFDNILNQLRK